jgi:hypothetical protein
MRHVLENGGIVGEDNGVKNASLISYFFIGQDATIPKNEQENCKVGHPPFVVPPSGGKSAS